eukprot:TRINITY_DN47797_c2_g1_i1.p2 TRINITY_DN47797_c2_g1~~TRINITY_DN47797_c2_g1_i1.p2  ORF type:complete len:115 (-),score=12.26 TRINITY_DN47797_c2_g1_i1:1180-1524(-)
MPSFFSTLPSTSQFEISSFWTNTHLTTGVNSNAMNKSKLAGSSTHPSFHENPYLNSSHHFFNINIPNKKSEIRNQNKSAPTNPRPILQINPLQNYKIRSQLPSSISLETGNPGK